MEVVRDNLVVCSVDCSELVNASEPDFLSGFKHILNELNTDLIDRSNYIDRLRAEKTAYVDGAESAERELLLENERLRRGLSVVGSGGGAVSGPRRGGLSVATQTAEDGTSICHVSCQTMDCLSDVETELSDLRKVMIALETEKIAYEAQLREMMHSFSSLQAENTELRTTIETLDHDNNLLIGELGEAKEILANSGRANRTPLRATESTDASLFRELLIGDVHRAGRSCLVGPAPGLPREPLDRMGKPRVLVFGDGSSRGIAADLRGLLGAEACCVYGESRSGFSILQMAHRIAQLTTTFNSRDSVIVSLNLRSFSGLKPTHLSRLFSVGRYTHVIFSLVFAPDNAREHQRYVSFCRCLSANRNISCRVLENTIINGRHRMSRNFLCNNLVLYIGASCRMRAAFSRFSLRYIDTVDLAATGCMPGLTGSLNNDNASDYGKKHGNLIQVPLNSGSNMHGELCSETSLTREQSVSSLDSFLMVNPPAVTVT